MRITIELEAGEDFPDRFKGLPGFEESIIFQVRQKLALRQKDEVILKLRAEGDGQ